MSEPIQSISQGNYILQGTVVTSAGIVGDGSPQNPLRLDETVLWSGSDIGTRTSAFTLSEPINNFERIRFEGYQYGLATPTYEITTNTGTTNISVCMTYFCKNADSNPFQIRAANYTSTNGLDYTVSGQKFMYWNLTGYTAAAGGNNTAGPNLTKIVGINRIGG